MTALTSRINGVLRRVPTWPLYILCLSPAPWLFWLAATGALSVEPIEALEHEYGQLALKFLVAGLCVTPLRRMSGINLLKFRRMLGLVAFAYVVLHLLVWIFLDAQILDQILKDIVKSPYITIGMGAFLALIPLAATSTNRAIRQLGAARWRRLHLLVYPAALMGALHYVLLVKGWQMEPLLYLSAIVGLLAYRLTDRVHRRLSGRLV